jgi:hypothetical protein
MLAGELNQQQCFRLRQFPTPNRTTRLYLQLQASAPRSSHQSIEVSKRAVTGTVREIIDIDSDDRQ